MALMLVIADDLTGAADCGVACAGHGLHTIVAMGDAGDLVKAEALSVDADTRHLPPNEAAQETARLLRKYLRDEETLIYKKLDSTLRGNLGAELAAFLEVRRTFAHSDERVVAVLAPAFPGAGRTTVNGRQLIHGKTLEESGIAQDREIAELLRQANLKPALLGLELIRGDSDELREAMKTRSQEADVLVCDAETGEDLRRIAEAAMVLGRGTVWAGSAGLAWHLPPAAGLARGSATMQGQPLVAGPVLFVIGSGSDVSREQVEVLAARSDTIVMRIPAEVLMAGEQSPQSRAYGHEAERALSAGSDVAVMTDPGVRLDNAMGPLLTSALAAMVRPLADRVGALVVTGGETARAVFEAWGVNSLRLIGEVEPGLPFSVTSGWSRELPVLTKAGAFGGPETLLNCQKFLRGLDCSDAANPKHKKG
jgi:4-hydroxythreonine-4-phosphate dehydrogenase